MAKLSARGRTKLAQVSREKVLGDLETCAFCKGSGTYESKPCSSCDGKGKSVPLCTWERTTRALMSDGNILTKLDVKFRPGPYDNGPVPYSYGWKVHGKVKAGLTTDGWIKLYQDKGWTVEKL